MRNRCVIVLIVLGVLVMPALAGAQVLGSVAGTVRDASNAVLPGVTVEAASPVLIEKVRTAVTDGAGHYQIVNLPPGAYSVSFSLPGFNTVKRDGVDIPTNFTATVDVEMRVGAVQETITVTGETPVVDLQSASQTRTLTSEVFKEIPSSGSWIQMAALVPAVRASIQDVGGVAGDQIGATVAAHGSLTGDGVSMIDGLRIGNMYLSSNLSNMTLSPLLFDEVNVQLSGQVAESGTNGVIMNAIPRSGGNEFHGSGLVNGSGPGLQGSNVTTRLNALGLQGASSTLKKLYDLNGAVGGPLKRDKLWFFVTSRYFTNEFYLASRFFPTDVTAVRRTPDLSQKAFGGTYTYDNNGRVTWGMSEKMKLSGWYAYQYKVDPHWTIQAGTLSPEASRITTWHTQLSTTKWTYTATNRLLFEAGMMAGASPDTIKLDPERVGSCPSQGSLAPRCIAIIDQSTNTTYRSPTSFDNDDRLPTQSFNVSTSYVTGTHNAKVGFEMQRGHFWRGDNNESTGGIWYTVNNTTAAQPVFVTIQAPLAGWQNNLNYNVGIFAQDRWTMNRLTLSGGARLDFLNESTAAFTAKPHRWLPNRTTSFAEVKNVPNWKDVNPRVSAAYDLFGNGKTALKASASRSIEQDSIRYAAANNPASTVATQTARTWTDANGNFLPECDLLSNVANGECGPFLTTNFGNLNPATIYDPKIMTGWGNRPYNWEFSTSVQQELVPRVSATVGYFRRVYGNFNVVDNEALGPNDFTTFSVVIPSNANLAGQKLPNAGQNLGGFVDPNFNPLARNVIKSASNFGKEQVHWDGFDVGVDARLQNGVYLQGGVSTGRTMSDICDVVDDVPEALQFPASGLYPTGVMPLVANPAASVWMSRAQCHQQTPFQPQWKALASYNLPYGVRVSGTWQSLPGPQIQGNTIYNNAATAAGLTTLGRNFTLAQSTLNVIAPGSAYGDRLNQFDLRFTKIVGIGYGRVDLNVDLYNAFNSDAVVLPLNAFGAAGLVTPSAWQLPLTVIQPRFVKFSARWDF